MKYIIEYEDHQEKYDQLGDDKKNVLLMGRGYNLALGSRDICLIEQPCLKEVKKGNHYCNLYQDNESGFDYRNDKNALIGKVGKECFIPRRLLIIQMK